MYCIKNLTFFLVFPCLFLLACFKIQPERTNPLDPLGSSGGNPFQLEAKPFYGQIHLKWQPLTNILNPGYNVYRRSITDPGRFDSLAMTFDTFYEDSLNLNYHLKYIYKISALSDNSESRLSDEATAQPYPTPNSLHTVANFDNPRFIKGFHSRIDPSLLFVLDNANAVVMRLNLSSNTFDNAECRLIDKSIEDFAISKMNNDEYILAVSTTDSSMSLCKVNNDSLEFMCQFQYNPSAIAASALNDSLAYVALHQIELDVFHIFKINYVTAKIICRNQFSGKRIRFMVYNDHLSKLFLLSYDSENLYVVDKNLNNMEIFLVGDGPKNIDFSSDAKFVFICCENSRDVYAFEIIENSLTPRGVIIKSDDPNEFYVWTDIADGEASDMLLFNLVYNQAAFPGYHIDIYQATNGINHIIKIKSLQLPGPLLLTHASSLIYIRDLEWKLWNLYIFAAYKIYYFLP